MQYKQIMNKLSNIENTSQQCDVLIAMLEVFNRDTVGLWNDDKETMKQVCLLLQHKHEIKINIRGS